MIPEAAVEAAKEAALHLPITNSELERILEAAAPHMQSVVTSIEEMHALPGGAVIIDSNETILEKSYIEPRWWQTMGAHDDTSIDDIELPATVIYRPTQTCRATRG